MENYIIILIILVIGIVVIFSLYRRENLDTSETVQGISKWTFNDATGEWEPTLVEWVNGKLMKESDWVPVEE